MNSDMNSKENQKWQSLLARATPTFAGESEPSYGMVTRTLARLGSEKRQQQDFERIGWRALLASLAALAVAATVTLSVSYMNPGTEFEPGVRSLIQMENFQVS
jgi:anti-sigma-K factor RskA